MNCLVLEWTTKCEKEVKANEEFFFLSFSFKANEELKKSTKDRLDSTEEVSHW